MQISLRTKIVGLVVGVGLTSMMVMALLTMWGEKEVTGKVSDELDQFIHNSITRITSDVIGICRNADNLMQGRISNKLTLAKTFIGESGGIQSGGPTVLRTGVRPSTGQSVQQDLPSLNVGGFPLDTEAAPVAGLSFPEQVSHRLGVDVAVYQRINEEGDMILLGTAGDGPIIRDQGFILERDRTPEIETVIEGKQVVRTTFQADAFYLMGYLPLTDSAHKVIGLLNIGEKADAMAFIRQTIMSIQVGNSGYVYILKGTGPDRGQYIISKDGQRDGENIWDAQDAKGHYFIRAPIYRIVPLQASAVTYEEFPWKNPGDEQARLKVVAMGYYKPWDWVIGAGTYRDDYRIAHDKIAQAMGAMLVEICSGGFILLILAGLAAWIISGRIAGPLNEVMRLADLITQGLLDQAKTQLGVLTKSGRDGPGELRKDRDEITQVKDAFAVMTEHLHTLIGQVRQSGFEVRGSATEISASARLLEQTVNDQAASTNQVAATSKEIAGRSSDLVEVITEVTDTVNETAAMANEGRKDLEGMQAAMGRLMTGTTSISKKLTNISQKAVNIGGIVTTIAKVADKTNLLSLNAAIEAEKAGEAGLGFSVVAREIRRLADQTAASTTDIENMVVQMQGAVSDGIMEMDKFVDEARCRTGEIGSIGANLAEIIDQVQGLTTQFDQVNQAATAQYVGAEEISRATALLRDAVEQTHDSLYDFNLAAEHLVNAVSGLQNEVARFTVNTGNQEKGKEEICEDSGDTEK